MKKAEDKKWKKFEKLVAEVQKSLSPNAKVTHNDKVRGKRSKTVRQIDISVRQNIGQYNLFIVIDCKDYKDPVDISVIEEFITKIKDVGANKGAIVSASRFTAGAQAMADDAGIDLLRLVDTADHDWKAYVTMPVLCVLTKLKSYLVKYRSTCKVPTTDPLALILYRENGGMIDTVFNIIFHKWNKGLLPEEPGIYKNIKLIDTPTCVRSEGNLYHIEVLLNLEVEKNLFFSHLPIEKVKGFQDQKTGGIISKGFTTGTIDYKEVTKKWQKIKSEKDLAISPTMTIFMRDYHPKRKIKLPEES